MNFTANFQQLKREKARSEAPTNAQMLLDKFGFIVIGSTHPMKIGEILPGTPFSLAKHHERLDNDVVVIAESNLQEAQQQVEALGGSKIQFEQFKYYYRAIAE